MQPPAITAAHALVAELRAQGVRDVVLAPGSRSAPLAYALAAAADAGTLTLHVRVDERAAAFLALGLSKGSEPITRAAGPDGEVRLPRPVAVVTTSGTAVANLHPAVLEAHHTGVPLVVLTADRPHELRGTGASQTTDQVGIFGSAVRYAVDVPAPDGRDGEVGDLLATTGRALAAALGLRDRNPGPVHLNMAFRDPLHPTPVAPRPPASAAEPPESAEPARATRALAAGPVPETVATVRADGHHRAVVVPPAPGPGAAPALPGDPARTVVVAGDGAGPVARALAEAQGWPLLAEPSSGACGGPHLVVAYRSLLAVPELTDDVEHVVVLGNPTLSRPVQRLLGRRDVAVTVVAPGGGPWPDAARNAQRVVDRLDDAWSRPADEPAGGEFLDRWLVASRAAAAVVDAATAPRAGATDAPVGAAPHAALAVARAVAARCGPDDVLVVGSSNPVRDLDLVLGLERSAGEVIANRGLAGIDGMVSTAYGVALAAARPRRDGRARRTRALLGDLTFLHDVGGLLRGPLEPSADLQLVVVNDDGGSIFATLEHGELAAASDAGGRTFERVFGTPHGVGLAPLCAAYGVGHRLVTDLAGLGAALAGPAGGVEVVEVRVPRAHRLAESRSLHREIVTAARAALVPAQDTPAR